MLTCAMVEYFAALLNSIPTTTVLQLKGLHGKMQQKKRNGVLRWFQSSDVGGRILLCTDVAARGLDLDRVDCVIQMDAPQVRQGLRKSISWC